MPPRKRVFHRGSRSNREDESGFVEQEAYELHNGSYAGALAAKLSEAARAELEAARLRPGAGKDGSKKKVAVLVAYCGADFKGVQINPGEVTVEAEVEKAMFLAGAISPSNFGYPPKVHLSRAARTDKGVHAASQVLSLKLAFQEGGEAELTAAINRHLPRSVRILDIRRVTGAFNPKNHCSARRYQYLLPTAELRPREELNELFAEAKAAVPAVAASPGASGGVVDGNSSSLPSACGAEAPGGGSNVTGAGLQEFGEVGARADSQATAVAAAAALDENDALPLFDDDESGEDDDEMEVEGDEAAADAAQGIVGQPKRRALTAAAVMYQQQQRVLLAEVTRRLQGYRAPSERVEALRAAVKRFEGTKSYHNYTSRMKATDAAATRYIMDAEVSAPFVVDGFEWVAVTLRGQSFLLHQIRKMVAVAVGVASGAASEADQAATFEPAKRSIRMAPGVGLYLDMLFFDHYNDRAATTPNRRPLRWPTIAAAVEDSLGEGGASGAAAGTPAAEGSGATNFVVSNGDATAAAGHSAAANGGAAAAAAAAAAVIDAAAAPASSSSAGGGCGDDLAVSDSAAAKAAAAAAAGVPPEADDAKMEIAPSDEDKAAGAGATSEVSEDCGWGPDAVDFAAAAAMAAFKRESIVGYITRDARAKSEFAWWMDRLRALPDGFPTARAWAASNGRPKKRKDAAVNGGSGAAAAQAATMTAAGAAEAALGGGSEKELIIDEFGQDDALGAKSSTAAKKVKA